MNIHFPVNAMPELLNVPEYSQFWGEWVHGKWLWHRTIFPSGDMTLIQRRYDVASMLTRHCLNIEFPLSCLPSTWLLLKNRNCSVGQKSISFKLIPKFWNISNIKKATSCLQTELLIVKWRPSLSGVFIHFKLYKHSFIRFFFFFFW